MTEDKFRIHKNMEPFIFASVNSKGTDQHAHPCNLISSSQLFCLESIIAVITKILAIILSAQRLKNFEQLRTGANKLLDQSASGYELLDQGLFAQFIK